MKKIVLGSLLIASAVFGFDFKEVRDFPTLDQARSIANFEANYQKYEQTCLNNTDGGAQAVSCFVAHELWYREVVSSYARLSIKLKPKERKALKASQDAWLNDVKKTVIFNSLMLNRTYASDGTMFISMRAGDAEATIAPLIKQRALLLKNWIEALDNPNKF